MTEIVDAIGKTTETDMAILFADESHFSNQPYVNRGWFKRGEKKNSKNGQKPIKQNYFWCVKHADQQILLEASRRRE